MRRLTDCGYVDNASALPTYPQPQQQQKKEQLILFFQESDRINIHPNSAAQGGSEKDVKSPTDSAEEAVLREERN